MKTLGNKIRKERIKQGLKVYELANKVGVTPVYITQIEKHGKKPSLYVFRKIEAILDKPYLRRIYFREKYPKIFKHITELKRYH